MCCREERRVEFVIQLYEEEEGSILVDLRLVKGYPISFMTLGSQLYKCLENYLR